MKSQKAITAIRRDGAILVFPINNRKDPHSLWYEYHPRTEMRWEWDAGGDMKVADLWHLRAKLSSSGLVVYSKWYQGRATFFSLELFTALLALWATPARARRSLPSASDRALRILEENSPISTKVLKKELGFQGKANESAFSKALKPLWDRGFMVGYGEVDDGAFPSLAVGATSLLFDSLWKDATAMKEKDARAMVEAKFPPGTLFRKAFDKVAGSFSLEVPKGFGTLKGSDIFLPKR